MGEHPRELEGRIAFVSGGGRGIGRGISELLAAHGAAVAINYRRDGEAARQTVEAIRDAGGDAAAFEGSVDDHVACQEMIDAAAEHFGGLDTLICNAGIASRGKAVADTEADEVARLMAVHAFGPHHLSRAAIPHLRRRAETTGRADIVMISSIATSTMRANSGPYNMGKAAMEALAFTLAKEERPFGIHVNVVAPGLVETDMGVRLARSFTGDRSLDDLRSLDAVSPFGRVCQPLDVANVVLWLCGPGSGYVTGQRIECTGGGG